MSSETSGNPDATRSASETRQDIVDYVLKHTDELSDVPCVKIFVDEHGRLTKEIVEAKARQERLAKAKEEYEPLEQRVGPCRLALNDAETELAKLYAPLGEAAFKALLTDDIDEQPLFADRLAAHKQVQVLQAESDALSPGADAGMVQKTKAKAKQLAIKAKIKLAERKFGGLQTEIGRKIVEDELDESIQCDPTNQLLIQIKDQRDGIASLSAELKEAKSELAESGKRLCETVGLASIGRSKDLDTAIKLGTKTIKQHDSDVATATRGLADTLKEVDASTLPQTLVPLLESLGNAPADDFAGQVKESRRKGVEAVSSAKKYWSGLSRRKRNQIVGGVAVAVIFLGVLFFRGGGGESDQIVGSTNGGDSSGNKEHTVQDKQVASSAERTPAAATVKKQMTPAQLALGDPVVNSVGMLLVPIPAGEFQMGSPASEVGRDNGETRHVVRITKPFYLGVHEVTQGQYVKVMRLPLAGDRERPWISRTLQGKRTVQPWVKNGPDYPAVHVARGDAERFCRKLSDHEGVDYRLPTEAEWEYACRAGTTTAYSFGDDASKLGQYAWHLENAWDVGERYAHRVGQKLPNPWGLYDMHGNVWERCHDWMAPYGSEKVVSDPQFFTENALDPHFERRVLRGGAFYFDPSFARSANRFEGRIFYNLASFIGFRVAVTGDMP